MPDRYIVGQQLFVTAQFANAAGVATDPLTVNFYYKEGANAVETLTRAGAGSTGSISGGIEKTGTGAYKITKTLEDSGVFYWRWESPDETSATVIDAEQGNVQVDAAFPASAY